MKNDLDYEKYWDSNILYCLDGTFWVIFYKKNKVLKYKLANVVEEKKYKKEQLQDVMEDIVDKELQNSNLKYIKKRFWLFDSQREYNIFGRKFVMFELVNFAIIALFGFWFCYGIFFR